MNRFAFHPNAMPPLAPALRAGEIHRWRVHLDDWSPEAESLAGLLSDDETRRAERFRDEALRRRFVVRRGLLRRVLSHYAGIAPQTLRFGAGPFGKPLLAAAGEMSDLDFSASHSQGIAVFAVAHGRLVGVDVECCGVRPLDRSHAELFLSDRELADWERLRLADQPQALLRLWTVKEACLKAAGVGLSADPKRVETPEEATASAGRVRIRTPEGAPLDLTVAVCEPVAGFTAAVAYTGDSCLIRQTYWNFVTPGMAQG